MLTVTDVVDAVLRVLDGAFNVPVKTSLVFKCVKECLSVLKIKIQREQSGKGKDYR